MKKLLIVAHQPSPNTIRLASALRSGAEDTCIENVTCELLTPFEATDAHVLSAHAVLLCTTENLGYMSGALKDFFDRIYYPCLEKTQGMPYALCVRAGHDGTGTCRSVASITTGLRWKEVLPPLVCRGDWSDHFIDQARTLGLHLSASLDAGII